MLIICEISYHRSSGIATRYFRITFAINACIKYTMFVYFSFNLHHVVQHFV